MEKIILNFSIDKKEINAEEYIVFCKKIILKLRSFDDIFSSENVLDVENRKSYFFKDDLSDFNTDNLKLIINKQKDIAYLNPNDENKELTNLSKSWMGFSSIIFFGSDDSIESEPEVTLSISQGATDQIPATIKIEYANDIQYKLSKEYVFKLIEEVTKAVKVIDAYAISSKFFSKIRRRGKLPVGWINYTRNKSILTMLKSEEARKELVNGVIFSISEKDSFDQLNQILIERSIEISDFLGIET